MKINLFGDNTEGLAMSINNQENINCYMMPSPDGRDQVALVGQMGSEVVSEVDGSPRGGLTGGGVPHFVMGETLYSLDEEGVATARGTVPGALPVSMAYDGNDIIVVNGTVIAYYYNPETETFRSVNLPDVAYTVVVFDTYAVFTSEEQRFYRSRVGDTDSFDPLDVERAIKQPDDVLAVWVKQNEIILFGTKSIEPWFNQGDLDFPFAQNQAGVMDRGLYARFSVAKNEDKLFFLGDDLVVYALEGYQPVRISDESIEIRLSRILASEDGKDDLEDAQAFIYEEHGHKFYQLNIPGRVTLTCNLATGYWHTRKHWDYNTHHIFAYAEAYGRHWGGGLDGNIYRLARDLYSDGDKPMRRGRRANFISQDDQMLHWKELKFIMDFGTTPVVNGDQGTDPQMMVRWSYDSGRTWRNEKFLTLGRQGDYLAKAIKRNCGSSRNRQIEFFVSDPVPFFMIAAFAVIK